MSNTNPQIQLHLFNGFFHYDFPGFIDAISINNDLVGENILYDSNKRSVIEQNNSYSFIQSNYSSISNEQEQNQQIQNQSLQNQNQINEQLNRLQQINSSIQLSNQFGTLERIQVSYPLQFDNQNLNNSNQLSQSDIQLTDDPNLSISSIYIGYYEEIDNIIYYYVQLIQNDAQNRLKEYLQNLGKCFIYIKHKYKPFDKQNQRIIIKKGLTYQQNIKKQQQYYSQQKILSWFSIVQFLCLIFVLTQNVSGQIFKQNNNYNFGEINEKSSIFLKNIERIVKDESVNKHKEIQIIYEKIKEWNVNRLGKFRTSEQWSWSTNNNNNNNIIIRNKCSSRTIIVNGHMIGSLNGGVIQILFSFKDNKSHTVPVNLQDKFFLNITLNHFTKLIYKKADYTQKNNQKLVVFYQKQKLFFRNNLQWRQKSNSMAFDQRQVLAYRNKYLI